MKSFVGTSAIALSLMVVLAGTPGRAAQSANQGDERRVSGSALYDSYCATCHGTRGVGDGPLAAVLRKTPANLTLLARNNGGVFSPETVSMIIDGRKPVSGHGGGDMPVWGDAFDRSADGPTVTRAKIAALVGYLESIQERR